MQIEHIREFLVFSRYMSFTKAANVLHLSQSTLNKHIHQLETDAGFSLVESGFNHLRLSPAGQHFLHEMLSQMEMFDKSLEECRQIEENYAHYIVVREPTFMGTAARSLYEMASDFQAENHYLLRFDSSRQKPPVEAVLSGDLHAHLLYEFGTPEEILDYYKDYDLTVCFLGKEGVVARVCNTNVLAEKQSIVPADLRGLPLATTYRSYDPMRVAIKSLCRSAGFKPQFESCMAESLAEHCMGVLLNDFVQIVPECLRDDIRFACQGNAVFVPFKEEYQLTAIMIISNSKNSSVTRFREFMKAREVDVS